MYPLLNLFMNKQLLVSFKVITNRALVEIKIQFSDKYDN